jgi:hypothetical protein
MNMLKPYSTLLIGIVIGMVVVPKVRTMVNL